jgi:hypothetical protein
MTEQYLDVWQINRKHNLTMKQRFYRWITRLLARFVPSLISGLDPSTLAIVGDVSHWNGDIDVKTMKAGGLAMLWTKASDGKQIYYGAFDDEQTYIDKTLRPNVQKCYDAGIPCGLYHFYQPLVVANWTNQSTAEHNYKMFKAAVKGLVPGVSFHAISIDFEVLTANDYNTNIQLMLFFKMLRADPAFVGINIDFVFPIEWYSSMRFFNLYPAWATSVSSQGTLHCFWMAQYIFTTGLTTTWENLKSAIIPKLDMRVSTPGFASWDFVQWSASIKLPGCNGALDLNFYRGSADQLYARLHYTAPVIPPPPPVSTKTRFRVTAATLNIRSGPGTAYADLGDMHAGDIVEELDAGGTNCWIQTDKGWVCKQLGPDKFMEVVK